MFDRPSKPKLINYIYGLGGREIDPDQIRQVFDSLQKVEKQPLVQYLGVRE
jgi:pyruvate ferredoxin oxidoreductase alpha subunit